MITSVIRRMFKKALPMPLINPHEHVCTECHQIWFHEDPYCNIWRDDARDYPCPRCQETINEWWNAVAERWQDE